MLTIKTFEVNPLQENCYILSDPTGEAVIIDCGAFYPDELTAIDQYIADNKLQPKEHLLTHAHFDHTFGCGHMYEKYGLKARFHVADDFMFHHIEGQPMMYVRMPALHRDLGPAGEHVDATTVIRFGQHELSVLLTPGHTQGGVCYYCAEEHVLFSGDSLFYRSIGRTDHPGGDHEQLVLSLRAMLGSLPDGITIYPGHGPITKSDAERCANPFLI